MAILRSAEILEMGSEELEENLSELRKDLMKIKGVLASGGIPEDVGKAREIKRTIAKILTHKRNLENLENLEEKVQDKKEEDTRRTKEETKEAEKQQKTTKSKKKEKKSFKKKTKRVERR